MLFVKKYSGWLLFLLFSTIIYSMHVLQQSYQSVAVMQEGLLGESVSGKIKFQSFEHTLKLANNGAHERKSVIQGILQFPKATDYPVPAIILLHGSLGVSSVQTRYAREFNKIGIATLIVDSFTSRNIKDTVGQQNRVTFNTVTRDAFSALQLLQRHPRIDPHRVAVIGWSKGGYAAHQTGTQFFYNAFHDKSRPKFAAHIAIYPWCGEHTTNLLRTSTPTLFIVGDKDTWVGHESCITYAKSLREVGHDVKLSIYPGVGHGFDYAGSYHTYLPYGINWSQCEYVATEFDFVEAATGEVQPWIEYVGYLQRCSSKGVYLKSNAYAREKAMKEILGFLKHNKFGVIEDL